MSLSNTPLKVFLLVLPLLLGCRNDDDSMTTPLSVCSDGEVFALDLLTDIFPENQIWLTETGGAIAADEEWDVTTGGIQFFNFDEACEDTYTLSLAGHHQESAGPVFTNGKNLWVREVAAVPNGTSLNTRVLRQGLESAITFIPAQEFELLNCPMIDSVRFWLGANRNYGADLEPAIDYTYLPEDDTYHITVQQAVAFAGSALFAIRVEESGQWYGSVVDLFGQLPAEFDFELLSPLELKPVNINWPNGQADVDVEIRWVNDIGRRRSLVLGINDEQGLQEVPMPPNANGPFAVYASWWDEHFFETQQVFESWPSEVDISFQIEAEITDFTYPVLQYEASGANIAVANGFYSDSPNMETGQRWYAGPSIEGQQTIRFAPLSFALRDSRIAFLYDRAYQATASLKLTHYAHMNGDYRWYLQQVYSDFASGEDWLKTLDYEAMTLAF